MIDLAAYKKTTRDLVSNELDLAFKSLKETIPSFALQSNQLYLLLGQFSDVTRDEIDGVRSKEEITLAKNKIRRGLLDLLDSLTDQDFTETRSGGPGPVVSAKPKFVLIYATQDQNEAMDLMAHLRILIFTNKIEVFNVNTGLAAAEKMTQAEEECAKADYLLVLISKSLFSSEWFELVYKAYGSKRRVIPVRLKPFDYKGTGLEKLNSLPTLNRVVTDFPNPDDAYTDIVSEIRRLLPQS